MCVLPACVFAQYLQRPEEGRIYMRLVLEQMASYPIGSGNGRCVPCNNLNEAISLSRFII